MDAVRLPEGRGVQKSKQKGIRAGEMVQCVECLPGKHEDSSSIPSTAKLGVAMAGEAEIGLGLAGLVYLGNL